jgi:transcriptional regulator with PAS, ATPase and Fis domain
MFIKTNSEVRLTSSYVESFQLLPNGTYLTKFDVRNNEYYLELTEDFTTPNKIYGNSELLSTRYVNTFNDSTKNMGILLTGLKGTGKSLTAKLTAIKSNIPVILITEEFVGEEFKSFLNNIKQEVVIFIDEFEKVYSENNTQQSLLSLLDGVFEGKKLFIFTSNMVNKVNTYMLNRPGRIRYLAEYESLDESVINDVINDILINKSNISGLLSVLDILGSISMDSLVSLITEMNTYGETANEAIKYLNIRPEDSQYSVNIMIDGIKVGTTSIRIHPLRIIDTYIEFYNSSKKEWDDIKVIASEWETIREGKTVTMKLEDIILYFQPTENSKIAF